MKRTFFKLSFLMVAFHFLAVACVITGGSIEEIPFTQINDIKFSLVYEDEIIGEGGTIGSQELQLMADIDLSYIANQSFSFYPKTYALSPPENGLRGMKNPITEIHISSDDEILDLPTDHSLNDFIQAKVNSIYEERNILMDIDELIIFLNETPDYESFILTFQEPFESKDISFTLHITYENGSLMELQTQRVQVIE